MSKVVHSNDAFAPVAYLNLCKIHLEDKAVEDHVCIRFVLFAIAEFCFDCLLFQSSACIQLNVYICNYTRTQQKHGTKRDTMQAYTFKMQSMPFSTLESANEMFLHAFFSMHFFIYVKLLFLNR